MSKNIGVFTDISDLYNGVSRKFSQRKLDYGAYLKFIEDLGTVIQAIAYGAQIKEEANPFIYALKQMGYIPKYRVAGKRVKGFIDHQVNWNVGIAVDIFKMIDRLDIVVIGSSDGNLLPLVEWLVSKGIIVIILAAGIDTVLADCSTQAIEIPTSLLVKEKSDE